MAWTIKEREAWVAKWCTRWHVMAGDDRTMIYAASSLREARHVASRYLAARIVPNRDRHVGLSRVFTRHGYSWLDRLYPATSPISRRAELRMLADMEGGGK